MKGLYSVNKRFTKYLLSILVLFLATNTVQSAELEDVIYLKNGSTIRGVITEQDVQDGTYRIQTMGGSVFVYTPEDIEKVTKEPKLQSVSTQSTINVIQNEVPSRNHAIGIATWGLSLTDLNAPAGEDDDTQFNGAALTYQFSFNNYIAMRFNLYSAEHEDFSDLVISGMDGQVILTTNARNKGFKFYLGAGYFDEKWDNGNNETSFSGGEFIFGLGYNWSRVGLDLAGGVRPQSAYDAPDEADLLFVTGSLRLTYRF